MACAVYLRLSASHQRRYVNTYFINSTLLDAVTDGTQHIRASHASCHLFVSNTCETANAVEHAQRTTETEQSVFRLCIGEWWGD